MKNNDIYQLITDQIIAQLEKGKIPWEKPWQSTAGVRPMNFVSKKAYRGINVVILGMAGRTSPYWLTYKQAADLGGHVRKGEKGTQIVFWKISKFEQKKADGTKEEKTVPMLRLYTVFNADQVEGIEFPKVADIVPNENDRLTTADLVVSSYEDRPTINSGFEHACYIPIADRVEMPVIERFRSSEDYYCTLFHELIHSTGHEKRCNRDLTGGFGSEAYAREELTAEMGATFLCAHAQIERQLDNSAAYIQGWLTKLRNDSKLVVVAAGKAEKAVDYILGAE